MAWLYKAAGADQSDAQVAIANYLLRGKQPTPEDAAKARMWLERAVTHGNRDAKFYLAALLAASPDEPSRDPRRALELLKTVMRDVDQDPTSFEIRAAANASLGNFDNAKKDQAKALRMARTLGWDLASAEARLREYESNRPFTGDLFAVWNPSGSEVATLPPGDDTWTLALEPEAEPATLLGQCIVRADGWSWLAIPDHAAFANTYGIFITDLRGAHTRVEISEGSRLRFFRTTPGLSACPLVGGDCSAF
jgi:tetratricopeptide (TPR) repeat protein